MPTRPASRAAQKPATETISALHDLFNAAWPTSHGLLTEPLTTSHLTSDDRVLTSAIAEKLRNDITLDDGSLPLGVRYVSKHGRPAAGTGTCWAYWMRYADAGLDEPVTVGNAKPIGIADKDFNEALKLCKIRAR